MSSTFGASGDKWLTEIDAVIDACAASWGLVIEDAYADPSYQLVFRATGQEGCQLALKVGVPRTELRDEAVALRLWAGRGTVKIVAEDPDRGALLLERIDPGTQLAHVAVDDDDAATVIGGKAFVRVAAAGEIGPNEDTSEARALPMLAIWADGFRRYAQAFPDNGPIDRSVIARAASIFGALNLSTSSYHVLHGDLHHHNILRSGPTDEDWIVVDPKGVVGDPAFEAGAFLRNPVAAFGTGVNGAARTRRRVDILVATSGIDRERMLDWAWAGTVLSAVWCIESDAPDASLITWPMTVAQWIAAAR
jgi:streptomycin 6-kinase